MLKRDQACTHVMFEQGRCKDFVLTAVFAHLWLQCAEFYKSWDRYGSLSNFSAHPVSLPDGPVSASGSLPDEPLREWPSVEHFYQAQKFAGAPSAPLQPP